MVVSASQKYVLLEKEYLYSDRTSDAKILMACGKEVISLSVKGFLIVLPGYKLFTNGWVNVLLFLHNCRIKTFNMYVYNILNLILAYNCK